MRQLPLIQRIIPTAGLLVLTGFSPLVLPSFAAERRETLRGDVGDLSGAKNVEVRDAAGQAVLKGQFVVGSRRDDDTERIAALKATGTNGVAIEAKAPQEKNGSRRNGDGRGEGDERDDGDRRRNRNGNGENAVARGTIEIETRARFFGIGNTMQTVDLSVRGLAAGARYNLLIDGRPIASFDATPRGRAEIVWEGPLSR